jgi:hypothetical protein
MPVTTPPDTVAFAVLLLLHMPPVVATLNVVVADSHTAAVPVIVPTEGDELTVTIEVAADVPQLFVTE